MLRLMISDFEAAVEAAVLRQAISSRDIVDPEKSLMTGNEYILKTSENKLLIRIPIERVKQLQDPEELKKAQELVKPQKRISPEELEQKIRDEKEELEKKNEELNRIKEAEQESFDKKVSEGRIKLWDYKHIRLDYKGRGITQEINILDIDGERIRGWTDNFSSNEVPTLPEVFEKLGNEGWEMVSHVINQDIKQNGVTLHYYNFKREKL